MVGQREIRELSQFRGGVDKYEKAGKNLWGFGGDRGSVTSIIVRDTEPPRPYSQKWKMTSTPHTFTDVQPL